MGVKYPSLVPMMILGKLRNAGIPVRGFLEYHGVECGTLTKVSAPFDLGVEYHWKGDVPCLKEDPNRALCAMVAGAIKRP